MFFQIEGYTRFLLNPPNQTKGRTFQNVRLMRGVSLLDNMRPAFHLSKISGFTDALLQNSRFKNGEENIRSRIEEVLDTLGIRAFENVKVEDMPYGVQKRAELARAMSLSSRTSGSGRSR